MASSIPHGDVERGKLIFYKNCSNCHNLEQDTFYHVAPGLGGVIGRKAGKGDDQFCYTKQMKASKITWNEQTLFDFLKEPQKFVKGTRMGFEGIKSDKDRIDLISFLKTLDRPEPKD